MTKIFCDWCAVEIIGRWYTLEVSEGNLYTSPLELRVVICGGCADSVKAKALSTK